ncbi:MAG: NACHT domain-containing protein, partial [Bacteroidota bacterium]
MEKAEIAITPSFFTEPKKFGFLKPYQWLYFEWLQEAVDLSEAEARRLAKQLPTHFAQALSTEWNAGSDKYSELEGHFRSNPFADGADSRQRKETYYEAIEQHFLNPIFKEEALFLHSTYICPRFQVHKRMVPDGFNEDRIIEATDHFVSLQFDGDSIHDYINHHFVKGEACMGVEAESSNLILLLGQPGQGKTSFCYKLIHDALNDLSFDRELVFLRLRELRNPREFLLHPMDELDAHFSAKGIEFAYDNTLLLLDGLDELFMVEGLTNVEISEFINQMSKIVRNRKPNLQVIITSRFHYVDLKNIGKKQALVCSLSPLNLEEQTQWLNAYRTVHSDSVLTKEILKEINESEEEKYKEIRELINQPILLYLIAKADYDITEGGNRSIIYDDLFTTLIKRNWSNRGDQLEKFENIDQSDFRDFIGAIALKMYQSEYEFIYKSDLLEIEEIEEYVTDNLKGNYQSLKESLEDILISFYFNVADDSKAREEGNQRPKEDAIEFLHKS